MTPDPYLYSGGTDALGSRKVSTGREHNIVRTKTTHLSFSSPLCPSPRDLLSRRDYGPWRSGGSIAGDEERSRMGRKWNRNKRKKKTNKTRAKRGRLKERVRREIQGKGEGEMTDS